MKLPTKLKIGYKTWNIIEKAAVVAMREGYHGTTDHDEAKIEIFTGAQREEVINTTLHEILHALFYVHGMKQTDVREYEEYIVNTLANGLTQVMLDNEKTMKELIWPQK